MEKLNNFKKAKTNTENEKSLEDTMLLFKQRKEAYEHLALALNKESERNQEKKEKQEKEKIYSK